MRVGGDVIESAVDDNPGEGSRETLHQGQPGDHLHVKGPDRK